MTIYIGSVIFLLGLIIGSFLNVCIYRIPEGKSIAYPPSSCPGCGTRLKPLDLVPILSYVFLKGKCRYCKKVISARYPVTELITGMIYLVLYLKYGMSFEFIAFSYLLSILLVVFFIDIDHRIIPNGLVIAGLVGGAAVFVYNLFYSFSPFLDRVWWNPLAGIVPGSGFLLVIAVIGFFIYRSDEAMGMGDVKIFAPIGMFLGWRLCILALLVSVVLGGFSGIALMIAGKKGRKDTMPYGPFIVLGTFITVVWGWDLVKWYIGLS